MNVFKVRVCVNFKLSFYSKVSRKFEEKNFCNLKYFAFFVRNLITDVRNYNALQKPKKNLLTKV